MSIAAAPRDRRLGLPICCALSLFACQLLGGQRTNGKSSTIIENVRVDADSRVHIIDSTGADTMPPMEKGQVGSDSTKIAEDKQTAGWLVNFPQLLYVLPGRLLW